MKKYSFAFLIIALNLVDIVVLLCHADVLFEEFATLLFCVAVLLIGPAILLAKLKSVPQEDFVAYNLVRFYGGILLFFALCTMVMAILIVIDYLYCDVVLTALLILGGIGLCVYGLSIFGSLKIILGYLKKR